MKNEKWIQELVTLNPWAPIGGREGGRAHGAPMAIHGRPMAPMRRPCVAHGCPLFLDGPGCRQRHLQFDFFDLAALENHCRKNCNMLSKTESKWIHENVK